MCKRHLTALLLALLPLLAGCGEDNMATPALRIEIRDARTGTPVYDVRVAVRDGAYVDTKLVTNVGGNAVRSIALMAENRPGTYDVTITHPAYQTWQRANIRVTTSGFPNPASGSPVPDQVHILAELEPRDGG